jgi:hypothetical protein
MLERAPEELPDKEAMPPGGVDQAAKIGSLSIRLGLGWAKSHAFQTGQTPVRRVATRFRPRRLVRPTQADVGRACASRNPMGQVRFGKRPSVMC